MATPTPADPLTVLASLYASPFLVRLVSLPRGSGWRLELSEDDGTSWTSVEAGRPGHASPELAIGEGSRLIGEWRASREQATSAEIAFYFTSGKLERKKIQILDDNNKPVMVDGYAVLLDDGSKVESTNPLDAINKAKAKAKK